MTSTIISQSVYSISFQLWRHPFSVWSFHIQLICYARVCCNYADFLYHTRLLTIRLVFLLIQVITSKGHFPYWYTWSMLPVIPRLKSDRYMYIDHGVNSLVHPFVSMFVHLQSSSATPLKLQFRIK